MIEEEREKVVMGERFEEERENGRGGGAYIRRGFLFIGIQKS